MQDEVIIGYTAHYAAPEVAKAVVEGNDARARTTMDIFSLGLVALEMLRGAPLIPASSSKEEALRTLGGDGLDEVLREAMAPLPVQLKALLNKMLEISPAQRTSAVALKSSSALTGNVRGPPAAAKHTLLCACHRLLTHDRPCRS